MFFYYFNAGVNHYFIIKINNKNKLFFQILLTFYAPFSPCGIAKALKLTFCYFYDIQNKVSHKRVAWKYFNLPLFRGWEIPNYVWKYFRLLYIHVWMYISQLWPVKNVWFSVWIWVGGGVWSDNLYIIQKNRRMSF